MQVLSLRGRVSTQNHRCHMCAVAPGQGKQGSYEIAEWFDQQNEGGWEGLMQAKKGCDVISLAHFLPHQVQSVNSLLAITC